MKSTPKRATGQVSPVAGVKRSAPTPSLLPPFEPLSSSPGLPRPAKRQARLPPSENVALSQKYPTPVPTSSTGIISSSPPPLPSSRRPPMQRTQSAVSERAPLSAVPSITLEDNGEPILMGRSSNSSHYQLSANRLISRVHVRVAYIPATSSSGPNNVQVLCMGWNGVKVHCQNRAWELGKGDSFTSETEDADIMLDVQDARVVVQWPQRERKSSTPVHSDSTWDDENSPLRGAAAAQQRSPHSSPLRHRTLLQSPVSPSPAVQAAFAPSSTISHSNPVVPPTILVYEDERLPASPPGEQDAAGTSQSTQFASQPLGAGLLVSDIALSNNSHEFSDRDEENDPIIRSFGPFGDNLLPRMASFTAGATPDRRLHLSPLKEASSSPQRRSSSESTRQADNHQVMNHVMNQLAFSRLSSTPLSTILNNLPADLKGASPICKENKGLTPEQLKRMLDATSCIGEVAREGKDAAGKPLESEYYYIAEFDTDEQRRGAVVDGLKKPGLRACRKQHKQYYWRKPKKP